MSDTTATPQEQSKTETSSGLDRLSQDPEFIFGDNKPETTTTTTTTTPAVTATEETAKLEGEVKEESVKTETTTTPAVTAEPTPEEKLKAETELAAKAEEKRIADEVFKLDSTTQLEQDNTWKALLTAKNVEIPADFTEEKGLELYEASIIKEYDQKLALANEISKDSVFEQVPETNRSEAKLYFDLMAQGLTLEQINAPINSIRELKALSPEQLIRKNLEGLPGWDSAMVDSEMEKLVEKGAIDIEHKKLILYLDGQENQINSERQQQINIYNQKQQHLSEQKRQQELSSFKTTLDRMPEFMGLKLNDDVKRTISSEYENGAAQNLLKNPEKVAKFMLWEKFGERALKYQKDRVLEQLTLEKAKLQHNVPTVQSGNQNRTSTTNESFNTGMDRLAKDDQFK